MLCAYYFLYNTLENTEHAPKLKIIDNEAPAALKWLLHKNITVVQLDPPTYPQKKRSRTCYINISKSVLWKYYRQETRIVLFICGIK